MKIFNKSEWKKVKLGDICDILDSRRIPISEEKRIKGKYPYYGANGIQGYINDYIFDEELVLLAEDGGNFGSKTKPIAYKINGKTWVNNHAHVLRGKGNISTRFLYLTFCRFPITGVVTGSAQPKISKGRLEKLKILVPDAITMEHFNNLINPMFDEINVLKKQLIRITKQRDMLLPRLMSGKIKV